MKRFLFLFLLCALPAHAADILSAKSKPLVDAAEKALQSAAYLASHTQSEIPAHILAGMQAEIDAVTIVELGTNPAGGAIASAVNALPEKCLLGSNTPLECVAVHWTATGAQAPSCTSVDLLEPKASALCGAVSATLKTVDLEAALAGRIRCQNGGGAVRLVARVKCP